MKDFDKKFITKTCTLKFKMPKKQQKTGEVLQKTEKNIWKIIKESNPSTIENKKSIKKTKNDAKIAALALKNAKKIGNL